MTALVARVDVDDLDRTIEALAASGITNLRLRFDHPAGVQFALVGDVVVLAGSADTLESLRATGLTGIVDDLDGRSTSLTGRARR